MPSESDGSGGSLEFRSEGIQPLGKNNGFDDPLVQELLVDAAENFFGARSELEQMVEVFEACTDQLKERVPAILKCAGSLNYLLLTREIVTAFYRTIDVEPASELIEAPEVEGSVSGSAPSALTLKGRFIRRICFTYDRLQRDCREYMNGSPVGEDPRNGEDAPYFNMLRRMCELINERVDTINQGMEPARVLQFTRQFDTGATVSQKITGATVGQYSGIDAKYHCSSVDFDARGLPVFPELPAVSTVKQRIEGFARQVYTGHREAVRERIQRLVALEKT